MLFPEEKRECPECKAILKNEDKIFGIRYFCDKCYYQTIEWHKTDCCANPMLRPRKYYKSVQDYYIDINNYKIRNQCQNCGSRIGKELKKSEFPNAELFDWDLEELGQCKRAELVELGEEYRKTKNLKKERAAESEYDEYRKTERWQKIREIVLERDNFICQSCLAEKAAEIHHTEGRFKYNEPIFSLVSLCSACHRKITEMLFGTKAKDVEKILYQFDKKSNC